MTNRTQNFQIEYPVKAVQLFGDASAQMIGFRYFDQVAAGGGTLAAGATANILAAIAATYCFVNRILLSIDAGGPYFISSAGGNQFRLRITGPFFVTMDFGDIAFKSGLNQPITLKNEHATVAGNYDFFLSYVKLSGAQ